MQRTTVDFPSEVAEQLYRFDGTMLAGTQLMVNPEVFEESEHTGPDLLTVTVADADLVGSSTEVALTTPWPALVAVNIPLLSTVPTAPVAVQVTPLVEPVTFAVNCWVAPTLTVEVPGVTLTDTPPVGGIDVTVTEAEADLLGSSTEVAVTVPVPGLTAV